MGKFEQSIPEQIKVVEAEIAKLNSDLFNLDWGHECDCEYCDHISMVDIDEVQQQYDEIRADIKSRRVLIERLKRHSSQFKTEVST